MKIEQLLVQHFYNSGTVTLQGMGTFTLSPDFVAPKENEKDFEMPDNAISFQDNPKAVEDDALISFIVQQTRKMKSLAAADLDSYLVLGRQFLNIGKPFKIEGMGMLVKNQQGILEFTKGTIFHAKPEAISAAAAKEKSANPDISFASETKQKPFNKKALLIAASIIGVLLVGAAIWHFTTNKSSNENVFVSTDTIVPKKDTVKKDTTTLAIQKVDSVTPNPATVNAPTPAAVAASSNSFKLVFMVTVDSAKAVSRMNALTKRGHNVIMYKADSIRYKLAEPFNLPLSDTTHIKDSLNRYYYLGSGRIELQ